MMVCNGTKQYVCQQLLSNVRDVMDSSCQNMFHCKWFIHQVHCKRFIHLVHCKRFIHQVMVHTSGSNKHNAQLKPLELISQPLLTQQCRKQQTHNSFSMSDSLTSLAYCGSVPHHSRCRAILLPLLRSAHT